MRFPHCLVVVVVCGAAAPALAVETRKAFGK